MIKNKDYYYAYLKSLLKDGEVFDEKTGTKLVESNGEILELKYCNKCKKWKPLDNFYLYNGKPIETCKDCKRAYYHAHKKSKNALIESLQNKIKDLETEKTNETEKNLQTTNQTELFESILTIFLKSFQKVVQEAS